MAVEAAMQLNTEQSIDLGRRVHRVFGSWKKAREAATKTDDGVYRIKDARISSPNGTASKG